MSRDASCVSESPNGPRGPVFSECGRWPGRHEMKARGLLLAVCLAAAQPAAAQWSVETEAGLREDSNLGNARLAADVVSDHALQAAVSATQTVLLDNDDLVNWGGRLAGESYARFAGLNNFSLGASASYRHKLGLGAYAPWLRAAWSSTRLSYVDQIRDGWLHEVDFTAGKRLAERWNAWANFRLERRTAAAQEEEVPGISGDAFSQRSRALAVAAEYAPDDATLLTFGGLLRRGDVVSTSRPDYGVFAVSTAIAEDPTFGDERYAYRLTGTSYGLALGLAVSLGPRSRLDIGLQRQVTHAEGGNDYAKTIRSVAWIGNF